MDPSKLVITKEPRPKHKRKEKETKRHRHAKLTKETEITPAADGATHQLLPLEPLESNHSFELRCHYSDAYCCYNTGKFICEIYSTAAADSKNAEPILKGSMIETTYCCSYQVKPYFTNQLLLETFTNSTKVPGVPILLMQIDTPEFQASAIEIKSPTTQDVIGTITLIGVHKYLIRVAYEKHRIIAIGKGSWFTGLWDYTFKRHKGPKIAYLESKSESCHLEFFGTVNTAIKACLIAFMLKTEIFKTAWERSDNYELVSLQHKWQKLVYYLKRNVCYDCCKSLKPYDATWYWPR